MFISFKPGSTVWARDVRSFKWKHSTTCYYLPPPSLCATASLWLFLRHKNTIKVTFQRVPLKEKWEKEEVISCQPLRLDAWTTVEGRNFSFVLKDSRNNSTGSAHNPHSVPLNMMILVIKWISFKCKVKQIFTFYFFSMLYPSAPFPKLHRNRRGKCNATDSLAVS